MIIIRNIKKSQEAIKNIPIIIYEMAYMSGFLELTVCFFGMLCTDVR